MDEVTLVAGDGDDGLRERLDQEINAFNAATTGYHDARLLSLATRGVPRRHMVSLPPLPQGWPAR